MAKNSQTGETIYVPPAGLMNLQPILEDDLIVLRPLANNDFEALYQVAKDPLIWEQHPSSDRYKKEVYTAFFAESIESKGAFIVLQKPGNKVIGSTRFKKVKNAEDAIEIGWSFLSRDTWGGTYNKAMKKLMIDYAFQYVEHIIFYIGAQNIRSQKAVQRIGGKQITNPDLKHLVKESDTDLTFRIGKEDWNFQ
ncbi:MAG: GNAT family N-acetyltransferase [Balneolales bacterium]|nr:GNAT family N-acetyltransferase [Balneolales bacterium]